MNRPFVAVVFAYVAGLLLVQIVQPPLVALFGAAFTILFLALALEKLRFVLIWLLLILAGWTNLSLRTAVIAPDDLRVQPGNLPALVTVQGRLAETPRLRITEFDDRESWHSVVRVHAGEIQEDEKRFPVSGDLIVNTPGILGADYFAGQPVEISGVIAPPPRPLAEGLFDYANYLAARGIFHELKTTSTNDWRILDPHLSGPPLTDRFLDWSKGTLARGLPGEDEPLRLLWAMTLGWRTAFTGDIGDPFLRAGTMHLFAIDGLRIALLSAMIVTFLRVLRISRAWCGVIAVPTIWFYTAATGWEPPAVRASVMMTIVLGGWSLKRPVDLLNSLALAAFIILLQEPRQLFEAGFQLSFFVVLVIGLMLPPLNEMIDRTLRQDSLLPDKLVPWWQAWLFKLARLLGHYGALSFAAWVGSVPLSAKYFHLFSPVSTLANIFAVPLGTLALMANLASLVCGAWFPRATELFNHAAWFFMVAMTWVSEMATRIPGAYFYVPEPSVTLIVIYYAVLIAILGGWLSSRRRKVYGAVVLLGLGITAGCGWEASRHTTELTILPLNGGHAVYVDAAGRRNDWLVDCGSAEAVDFTLKPFLRAQGVNRIPRLILTEGDLKNCGGAERLDQLFGIGELWTSDVKFRSAGYRETIADFDQRTVQPANPRHRILGFGQSYGQWQVLHPDPAMATSRADDNALVLLGDCSGTRILLLSDLSRDGQSALLSRTNDLRADIVVAGLPEKGEPLCDALLAAIHPRVIVIADSEKPVNRRASPALKQRLEQRGFPVVYTRTAGAVTIVTQPNGWALRTMDGQRFSSALP